ncbi:TonB C-terminal domain-containing protein [Undibacterium sp. Jales W-56]|uniref:TonB C-terminal domain-containing protein n=1 Tax=Undibacterium sp. Jales W-56 TaxID=2897325 RepID=UPI0021CFF8D0|nr:TonB C-terminal domain-containing protein [Undibacterium sp. Jales W-56]MCU6433476.1 TonB C-terminal domain-containing protein [Undibacterium sp. Jales W-56]
MQRSKLSLFLLCLLAGCASRPLDEAGKPGVPQEAKKPSAPKSTTSSAFTLNGYKKDLAQHISRENASATYSERPQALLRAVIVVKFAMNADGKLLSSELMRTNQDRAAEKTALASLRNSAPFPKPASYLVKNGRLELIETWLFNDDGRFQLRTIALPQEND